MSFLGIDAFVVRCTLLADVEVFEHLGSRLRPDGGARASQGLLTVLAVATVVVVLLWLLSRILRLREDRNRHSPRLLLKELTRAHRLSGRSVRLLKQVANEAKLENPLRLFIESKWLELARTKRAFRGREKELTRLRTQLFGDAPDKRPHEKKLLTTKSISV